MGEVEMPRTPPQSLDAVSPTDLDDIQAIIRSGFGKLAGCSYLLLRVVDAKPARAWLRAQHVASIGDLTGGFLEHVVQIAVTSAGLRALGLKDDVISGFSAEFVTGMASDPSRSGRLGDIGENAPATWQWGVGAREPHLLLMLFTSQDRIDNLAQRIATEATAAGLSQIAVLTTSDMKGREPFGFVDGVSQPTLDWQGRHQSGTDADMDFKNIISIGEIVLGYRNEYALYTESPEIDASTGGSAALPVATDRPSYRDLGRNGSYLVFRQLDQDVRGFWRWVNQTTGSGNAATLAEAMVGRRMSGDPLIGIETQDVPGVDQAARPLNGFTFADDPSGRVCPVGAHIRRANPRTGDFPTGRQGLIGKLIAILGLSGTAEADTIASARFHRLTRRGREYGRWLDPADAAKPDAPDPQSGLHFICLNANIARQFEFVQGAWLASAKFAGLSGESDPLLGNRLPFPAGQPTDRFTQPTADGPCRVATALPQFIHVRGGAYFFLPGLRALAWLLRD
jgi:deferrochelatase/peroxidase EfeB